MERSRRAKGRDAATPPRAQMDARSRGIRREKERERKWRKIEMTSPLVVVFLDGKLPGGGRIREGEQRMDRRKPMGQEGETRRERETSETTLATGHSRCKIKHYAGKKRRRPARGRKGERISLLHPVFRGDNRGFAVLNRNTRTHDIETLSIS